MPASNDANSAQGTLWLAVSRHYFSLRSTPGSGEPVTGHQQNSDLLPNDVDWNLGHSGEAGPSGLQPRGSDMRFDSTWTPGPDMAYPLQALDFHSGPIPPSVNHGSNLSIPSHAGGHSPTSNPSQNHFGAHTIFDSARYADLIALMNLMQQFQPSSTTRNGQSNSPAPGTRVVDRG